MPNGQGHAQQDAAGQEIPFAIDARYHELTCNCGGKRTLPMVMALSTVLYYEESLTIKTTRKYMTP